MVKKAKAVAKIKEDKKSFILEKLKTPRVFITLIVILVAGLLFYFRGLFVAAVVNGEPITRLSLISQMEKKDGKQMLSTLVTQTLISQEAKKSKIDVSQQEIDADIKKIEAGLTSQGQTLDQAMLAQGITREDLSKDIRIQKLVEKMFAKDVKVADSEVTDYIDKNQSSIPTNLTSDDVKKQVRQQLEQQKLSTVFQAWLDSAQKNAKINYFVNY
ncbi:MAG: SurA N-terminal domain-containing protein [Candidatus Levybacteria bacterium]|nr:SurA N-terminal domain-containing protein [Candidatus Levybacteria bacterium]